MRMTFLSPVAAAAFLLVTACATGPEPTDTGPPPETVIAEAIAEANPYNADEDLTELLARTTLTADQRAQALYYRGSIRRQAGDDRRGAVADFEEMLALAPDHSLAERAKTELEFARADVEAIETSMNRFLTLSQWFDGTWVLGDHDAAATRYQRSGLAPNAEQVKKLQAAGYVCPTDGSDSQLHLYGEDQTHLDGLKWCADLTS